MQMKGTDAEKERKRQCGTTQSKVRLMRRSEFVESKQHVKQERELKEQMMGHRE